MSNPCCSSCRDVIFFDHPFFKTSPEFYVPSFTSIGQVNNWQSDSDLFSSGVGLGSGVNVSGGLLRILHSSSANNTFYRGRYSTRDNDDVGINHIEYTATVRLTHPFPVTVYNSSQTDLFDPYIIAPSSFSSPSYCHCFTLKVSAPICLDDPSPSAPNLYFSMINIASISFARHSSTQLYVSFGQQATTQLQPFQSGYRSIQRKLICVPCLPGHDNDNRYAYGILNIDEADFFDISMLITPITLNNGNDFFEVEYAINGVNLFIGRYYAVIPPAGVDKRHFINKCAWNFFLQSFADHARGSYNNVDISSISATIF